MGLYQRSSGKWVISYTEDGARRRKSFSTKREAEAALKSLGVGSRTGKRFEEFAKEVLESMTLTHKANTVASYRFYLQALTALGDPRLAEIDLAMVRAHQASRIASGRSPATANREALFVSTVLSRAVQEGLLDRNPLVGPRVKTDRVKLPEPRRLRFLSVEEIARLEAECRDPLLGIVQVALGTGMRLREIFQLRWSMIDEQGSQILRKHKDDYSAIPLPPLTLKAIRRQPRTSLFVFPGRGGSGQRSNCWKAFSAAVERAGLEDCTFHTLRHTFASHAVMSGMDLRTLQEVLGHAKLDMVLGYAHLADRHKAGQVARLEAFLARRKAQLRQNGASDADKVAPASRSKRSGRSS